jgi:tetratricopeptide (TPR) repeat protein
MPEPERRPPPPAEIKTNDELYLTGLRIEQFHDPYLDPEPYWEEALKRDPGDARVHKSLGIRLYKQARYAAAKAHLRAALKRLTVGHTKPEDGEPYYYLGLALKGQGRIDQAFDAFYRATWSLAWRGAGYFALAEICTSQHDWTSALGFVNLSLESGSLNPRVLNLKAAILRHVVEPQEAFETLDRVLTNADPLDVRSMAERWLTSRTASDARILVGTLVAHPATALETAAEYQSAGLWEDGLDVLSRLVDDAPDRAHLSPLIYYDLAYFADKLGQHRKAAEHRATARSLASDYVFPFQAEAIEVLEAAMKADPHDSRAPYYLGNLLFDWQPEEAVRLWERAAELEPSLAMVHRNLAIAWSHRSRGNDLKRAISELEKAVSMPGSTPLHFFELDELYQAAGRPPAERLSMLEQHQVKVEQRAEVLSREIALLVVAGRCDDAIRLMTGRRFEVWEGGSLSVADDWVTAHIQRGHQHLAAGRFKEALADYEAARLVPDNLPSDEGGGSTREAEIDCEVGLTEEARGERESARKAWRKAADGGSTADRQGRRGGLSNRSEDRYFKAVALRHLGRDGEAQSIFHALVASAGTAARSTFSQIDSSASVTAQEAHRERLALVHYIAGLGHLGLGERDKARQELSECLKISPHHLGAKTALESLGRPR